MVASLVSCGGCFDTISIKKLVIISLLCIIFRKEILSKSCVLACIFHGFVFGSGLSVEMGYPSLPNLWDLQITHLYIDITGLCG
jgi:hypothetical protein